MVPFNMTQAWNPYFWFSQFSNPWAMQWLNTVGLGSRPPQNPPAFNPDMPAAQLANSTGGVGCEPGYNYFFPAEHTKVHVLKTGGIFPWHLSADFKIDFHACMVPTNVKLRDLMKGFGADNPNPMMNHIYEVTMGSGNAQWYKGLHFSGDQLDEMEKPISSFGWNKDRTGLRGDKDVVWLYLTKG